MSKEILGFTFYKNSSFSKKQSLRQENLFVSLDLILKQIIQTHAE